MKSFAARRAAGLAYNLGGEDVKTNNQFNTRANSKLVGGGGVVSDETISEVKDTTESPNFIQTSLEVSKRLNQPKIRRGQIFQKAENRA